MSRERYSYAYKLVNYNGYLRTLESLFVPHTSVHKYKVGEWTRARTGGLLVFKSLKDARQFVYGNSQGLRNHIGHTRLYRVACKTPIKLPCARFSCAEPCAFMPSWLKALWNNKCKKWRAIETILGWPVGTIAYKEVRLIREVKCKFDLS